MPKIARPNPSEGFLSQLADHSDELFGKPMHEQYAALCYRFRASDGAVEVLLVTSRETRRWIIPKGWPMKGKKPHQVAAIEAAEEAGVQGRVKKRPFGYYTYLKVMKDGHSVPCVVSVFLLAVHHLDLKFREKKQRTRSWMSCNEAAREVQEPELRGLFFNLERKLRKDRLLEKISPIDAILRRI
jgi:8-oxo-dGTP pyrophosphatase MutT (NUDIX family)